VGKLWAPRVVQAPISRDSECMNGKTIQHVHCPRCAIPRTVRIGRSNLSFCFNCRWQWHRS